eukprot:2680770-Pleurochrysis_carterae.AAC.2
MRSTSYAHELSWRAGRCLPRIYRVRISRALRARAPDQCRPLRRASYSRCLRCSRASRGGGWGARPHPRHLRSNAPGSWGAACSRQLRHCGAQPATHGLCQRHKEEH